ncbi:unconventional myosin-IXAa-like [Salvelinus namaycush]|uniref:Unconventional myosin-IXAa-like n=1 Tax=Salvelinus namaycush TaxID=8040 RepID=A0A8U1BNX4_SALNM|nr:unconventional myosin-IXAa-like [Salvelinus namaycush]
MNDLLESIFSIGVLDIFGFEDYENNSFEQFCINLANERLQHYFNQHIFKLEQEEYRAEGISWHNIDYIDNTGCINLISKKPTALLHLLDEESNFPQASNQTLLDKFKRQHEGNGYIEFPAVMEPAFIIRHYAGKVKYGVKDFREKNTDHMRPDIVALLKSSKNAFICGLMGIDPPATFRWAVLRAFFRAMVAFRESGKRHVHRKTGVVRKSLRTPLSDLQGSNTLNEKSPRDGVGWNGRGGRQGRLSSSGSNMEEDGGIFVNSTSSKLLERAHGILMRNKNYKSKPSLPKHLLDVKSLKYLSNLTLHDRITKSLLHLHKKKKPPSISAQFQASLNKLMETLGQSEPYFVKCIRSNAEKLPLRFNDGLVLRQLRYTGMLETVRIRQSGYSIKYTFQDFVRHFRVLLPEGTSATQEGIGQYLGQVDLAPNGYQVGKTMVFLREVERQQLQALLHREVLNRIVTLQRRFRALLERKHFISMRLAATTIQKWWRAYQSKQEDDYDPSIQEGAALCIQTAWRGYKERWRFGLWREAALLLQREWRALLKRREREGAALAIQTAWRCHMAREAYLRLRSTMALLQAAGKGYLARQSFGHLKEQRLREKEQRLRERESQQQQQLLQNGQMRLSPEEDDQPVRIMGLDLSTWEDRSYKERERSIQRLNSQEERVKEGRGVEIGGEGGVARAAESSGRAQSEPPPVSSTATVVVRERTRTLDEPCQKTTRAKRESRRMRELEQAKFSLELLKVRATGSGGASSPSEERRWSAELTPTTTPPRRSPQGPGTPDSQSSKGSFELLSMDDEILRERAPLADEEELGSPLSSEVQLEQAPDVSLVSKESPRASVSDAASPPPDSQSQAKLEPAAASPPPPKIENYLPTFYVPSTDGSLIITHRLSDDSSRPLEADTTSTTIVTKPLKSIKQRRESSRRPVVVVISMQKETPLDQEELGGAIIRLPPVEVRDGSAQTGESPSSPRLPVPAPVPPLDPAPVIPISAPTPVPAANQLVLEKLERLNEEKEERQRHLQQQNEREMMDQIRKQKEVLERQRHHFAQHERELLEKQRGEALVRIQQSRQGGPPQDRSATTATSTRPLRPSSLLIERAPALAPPSRTQSVSAAHAYLSPPGPMDTQSVPMPHPEPNKAQPNKAQPNKAQPNKAQPNQARLPPPPSAPKTKTRDGRPIADGWAPNLTLESREGGGGGARGRVPKKVPANQGTSISMTDMSENIFFAPKDRVAFSKFDKEKPVNQLPVAVPKVGPSSTKPTIGLKTQEVSRAGHRKKARMARTRSDFLTRTPTSSLGCESEEDEYDGKPPLSSPPPYATTIPKQESFECFSDSEMPSTSSEEQKKIQKAMSSGDLAKVDTIRKNAQSDGRVRGKMRFWGKTKQGEKKSSREKLFCGGDSMDADDGDTGPLLGEGQDYMSPPRSPDLTLERGAKEFKENKEPSPKVKRRRSVKISSVTLEPAQWGNDALQILTCTNDYRSMNDFLMKKISDLVAEDGGKKDTMVDVVFKKALKEFRLNIFNSYSTALAMDDGKSIRYKDLYALFEQILEKTMRLEQRDWSESPVKVWVNTFKIFLDEFMTEYKPMDSTISKQVPKTERKKRRKKDADIVEEHNGHIFKATQYSIPTYCEYCSSLIWMMDRACVCKLCRYACHRKCCLKLTTKCSKKYDPELSSRQFGVEVSRLTNEERTVPLVVEKLINYIEMHGLYTEGIYRKSGSTNKIKELKQGLDTDVNNMNLDDYNIHVIASVFKQWLRDLPNPLMTFELYEEFLRAMCLQDKKEVIRGVYSIIDQLSRTHLNTLERLFFHLVRIAGQEDTNRMSANALAIVFAPCILRCPDTIDPLQSVQDIGKTTACVELIIGEQMNKYCARLKDINSLEFAENKAKCRLTLIRRSMGKGHVRRFSYHTPSPPVSPRLPSVTGAVMQESGGEEVGAGLEPEVSEHQQLAMQQEERVLTEQIESLQKEKEELTFEMLTLEQRASDDETLESEASIGTADSSENLNVDSEGATSDFSGPSEREPTLAPVARTKRSEGKSHRRRNLRRQPDSQDSVDSCSTISSLSSSSHFHPSSSSSVATARHFRYRSKSPSSGSGSAQGLYLTQPPRRDSMDCPPPAKQEGAFEERSQFTSRGTFNPEKGKQKLKGSKNSPLRHSHDSGGRSRDPPDLPQQRVLYGSNEFMV